MAPGALIETSESLPAQKAFKPIIEKPNTEAVVAPVAFDPAKHLQYNGPPEIITMKDIGFEDVGVSPFAVSQPFKLFSEEAVQQMRAEIFNPKCMEEYSASSNLAAFHIRGYANKYGPFTHDAWHHPETLRILSSIAGVELTPVIDYELGSINFSVKSDQEARDELDTIQHQKSLFAEDEGIAGCPWEDNKPVVGWHKDSYPFVCVVMLSDCKSMVGGETALCSANGKTILKIRGPEMGCAVVLQGRYITHQALRAHGAKERITSVTSFRPKDPMLPDDTVLATVRGISDPAELYYQYAEYRLEMLEARARTKLKTIRKHHATGRQFDERSFKFFLKEQAAFLQATDNEILEYENVVAGVLPEIDMPNVVVDGVVAEDSGHPEERMDISETVTQG